MKEKRHKKSLFKTITKASEKCLINSTHSLISSNFTATSKSNTVPKKKASYFPLSSSSPLPSHSHQSTQF
jgi:hypothetical protein